MRYNITTHHWLSTSWFAFTIHFSPLRRFVLFGRQSIHTRPSKVPVLTYRIWFLFSLPCMALLLYRFFLFSIIQNVMNSLPLKTLCWICWICQQMDWGKVKFGYFCFKTQSILAKYWTINHIDATLFEHVWTFHIRNWKTQSILRIWKLSMPSIQMAERKINPQNAHAFPETIAFGILLLCLITTLFFIPADTYTYDHARIIECNKLESSLNMCIDFFIRSRYCCFFRVRCHRFSS